MDVNIQNAKIELIQWLTTLDDKVIIEKIMEFKKSKTKDWWEEITEAEKNSIEKGIKDAEQGKLNPQSEAHKVYEKWL